MFVCLAIWVFNTRIPGNLLFCKKGMFSGVSCATKGTELWRRKQILLHTVYASPIRHHKKFYIAYFIGLQPFNKYKMFYGGTSFFLFLLFVVSSCLILFCCVLIVTCSLCGLIWAADIGNSPIWSPGRLSYF